MCQPAQPGRSGLQPTGTEEVPESGAPTRGSQPLVPSGQCSIATLWGHRCPWARDELEESQWVPTQWHRCVSYRDCGAEIIQTEWEAVSILGGRSVCRGEGGRLSEAVYSRCGCLEVDRLCPDTEHGTMASMMTIAVNLPYIFQESL